MKQKELQAELTEHTEELLEAARSHVGLPSDLLQRRPHENSWNVLECYEHMNRFGKLYLRYFNEAINKAKPSRPGSQYRPGLLGGWSARSMEPKKNGGIRMPMKTFKTMDPRNEELTALVVERFIKQQEELLPILEKAKELDLDSVKCRTSLKYLMFKLSDALRFFVNHNRRHFIQIEGILRSADQEAAR
jgi:hypothetical protein